MFITSISFSYFFLILSLISLIFFFYYRLILMKTEQNSASHEKIIGTMKNPELWRNSNTINSYIAVFWFVISMIFFIYLKFFTAPFLLSIWFLFLYAAVIVLSLLWGIIKTRAKIKD